MRKFNIGCHLSSSNGYLSMGKEAFSIGANTFQFFTRNPRGGSAKPIDKNDISQFLIFAKEHDFVQILAHAPYTMNACSADSNLRKYATEMMQDDLQRMELIPNNLYNFHPGSHVNQGMEIGVKYISEMLNNVLFNGQTTTILLETMAGKGSEVGRSFYELQSIIDKIKKPEYIGICLDTCHVHDAGYDIVNQLDEVINEFDHVIGINRLKAIHLNDSKNALASHKDRHELIAKGNIGETAIRKIINHPQLANLPFLLETPNDISGYAQEIAMLKTWRAI